MSLMMMFLVIMLILAIGDIVATATKAFVPSVFVCAVLFVASFWTGLVPLDIVDQVGLGGKVAVLSMYLLIVHMGTMLDFAELRREWKTVTVAIGGLVGMSFALLVIARPIVGWEAVVIGTPPLSGGLVASIMMANAATEKGLVELSVLATVIFFVQGFVGYPLTAVFLKRESARLLEIRRRGGAELEALQTHKDSTAAAAPKSLIPAKYQTTFTHFLSLAVVAWASDVVAGWLKSGLAAIDPSYAAYSLHPLIICLLLGMVAAQIGIIERSALNKANGFGFLMMSLMVFIYNGLNRTTPDMIVSLIFPVVVIVAIGVTGLIAVAGIVGRMLGYSAPMAISTALTALYGFPPNYILSDEATKSATSSTEEREFLMSQILPKMLVGGFITVTITSVFLAGIFVNLL